MNASRMRKHGREAFCSEDTAEEFLKRVGHNMSQLGVKYFKQGWDEAVLEYEKESLLDEVFTDLGDD